MEEFLNKRSRSFEIAYYGLKLNLELFTIEYIEEKLKTLYQSQVKRLTIPQEKNPFCELKKIYTNENGSENYYFFAYIKFFECDGRKYGLVGGKTNYPYPDISFDNKGDNKDKRIARTFLNDNNFQWSHEIIIVNHEPFLNDKESDNQQAIFLEKFLQLQFHLFNS